MWQSTAAVISVVLSTVSLFFAWRHYREGMLRRDEVHEWANAVIRELQTLHYFCTLPISEFKAYEGRKRLSEISINTTVLIEQGRLFFRNQPYGDWGSEKKPAYRGLRPKILDPIVTAHEIAREWVKQSKAHKPHVCAISYDCIQEFVSLAQLEVARSKSASVETGQGGDGSSLSSALARKLSEHKAK